MQEISKSPAYLAWTYHKNISPGALLHTSTDHIQNSSYTLPLTLLKSSFSALRNIILSTFLLMQLQRQSVRVMKESHLLAGIIINPNRLTVNTGLCQFFHRLFHTVYAERKMA